MVISEGGVGNIIGPLSKPGPNVNKVVLVVAVFLVVTFFVVAAFFVVFFVVFALAFVVDFLVVAPFLVVG